MKFIPQSYENEMLELVDVAFEKIATSNIEFQIYTISIWTDVNSQFSSFSLDSEANSSKNIKELNKFNKKYYNYHLKNGDKERANLFLPIEDCRNSNPADFILQDFHTIENSTFPMNWEYSSKGKCWSKIEPILYKIGEYAFQKAKILNLHPQFELGINGSEDWYQNTFS